MQASNDVSLPAATPADQPLGLIEKMAYGAGNMAGTVVVSISSFLMYFYTDVAGLAAATAGAVLLLVKVWDAMWDLMVGRIVDRTRSRWGQCRPYLLLGAALFPLAMFWTFYLPVSSGLARWASLIAGYVALQMTFSTIMIPYQSLPVLMTARTDQRVHLYAAQALATFATVMLTNGATMGLVKAIGGADPAWGFLATMGLWGLLGGLGVLAVGLLTRERVAPHAPGRSDLRADLRLLARHRSWRSLIAAKLLFTVGLNLQLGLCIYYATSVLGSQAAIGPLMLAGALGLVLGVPLSLALLRRVCPKTLATATFAGAALFSLGFLLLPAGHVLGAQLLNALVGLMIGISGPAFGPASPNMVDHVELDSGRRLMGLGISTLNFSEKVAAGLASGLIGAWLAQLGYQGGASQQAAEVAAGMGLALALGPATFFGLAALVFGLFFPLHRQALQALQQALQQRRSAAAG